MVATTLALTLGTASGIAQEAPERIRGLAPHFQARSNTELGSPMA
jgi:hypothetical protein